ncbi:uncharacterized protein M421DRAFT_96311 [Didymella exigua CBS 183.55]|uniref:Uncharacterized protein n=1 Tax=Didymella exigua CBS 183.55 TaxID=1150837 RepID=A0A6A5R835_9PLEO|nr:uncharacterized protein M421DRAFT_96311 [Didymella exigua CBS 183.55]KAF1923134.1 hypothetical protein M421DRAFT_96311 [Didymella exigua CBS 183.55]
MLKDAPAAARCAAHREMHPECPAQPLPHDAIAAPSGSSGELQKRDGEAVHEIEFFANLHHCLRPIPLNRLIGSKKPTLKRLAPHPRLSCEVSSVYDKLWRRHPWVKSAVSETFSSRICTGRDIAQRPLRALTATPVACGLHIAQSCQGAFHASAAQSVLAYCDLSARDEERSTFTTPRLTFIATHCSVLSRSQYYSPVRSLPLSSPFVARAACAALLQALHRSLPYSSLADVAQRACWARLPSLFSLLPRPSPLPFNIRTDIAI